MKRRQTKRLSKERRTNRKPDTARVNNSSRVRVALRLCIAFAALMLVITSSVYWFSSGREQRDDSRALEGSTPTGPADRSEGSAALSRSASQVDGKLDVNAQPPAPPSIERATRYFTSGPLTMVWDTIKPDVRSRVQPISTTSNITRRDYAGPDACAECHKKNHADWSKHPHRWMNAVANEESVRGDFSGEAKLDYRGGVARFYHRGGKYMMSFDRSDLGREYEIHQTIGSRFYQYYVGVGVRGPEPPEHDYYHQDHVLPFGYWLERKSWVPIVHVAEELPDGQRWESVETLKPSIPAHDVHRDIGRSRGVFDPTQKLALIYAKSCNACHTTFPLADMFVRLPARIGPTLPTRTLFELSQYVASDHAEIFDGHQPPEMFADESIKEMTGTFIAFDARDKAVTLGVSCEACHLGCQHHVDQPKDRPAFVPQSPHLLVFDDPHSVASGRQAKNSNAICGRCHVGERPVYAGGMATWNSTEYSDAMRGACYTQLSCVNCHEPHQALGNRWSKSSDEDDQSCLRCHQSYSDARRRSEHTHHRQGTDGDRCMNCHMPHINEGIGDVVRTHTIFSPTEPRMLKANQPNACNLCHLDQTLTWTTGYLRKWYGLALNDDQLDVSQADLQLPAGTTWLRHTHAPTRLVAAAAFARQNAQWAVPQLIDSLNDSYLINRQFNQVSLERLLGVSLDEKVGYWFHQSPEDRMKAIEKLKQLTPPPGQLQQN